METLSLSRPAEQYVPFEWRKSNLDPLKEALVFYPELDLEKKNPEDLDRCLLNQEKDRDK